MALAHAILAMLMDRPRSGYDLRKCFEGSVSFFWQASFQQIYRELGKLEDKGLVQSEAVTQKSRPDKKIFAVTVAGESFLEDWLKAPCEMAPIRDELMVKMYAGFLVPRTLILEELNEHLLLHQQRLAVYQQIQQDSFADPTQLSEKDLFRYLTLCGGIQYEKAWLNWYEEVNTIMASLS